jgi:uncharacterized protein (DUF58 family)
MRPRTGPLRPGPLVTRPTAQGATHLAFASVFALTVLVLGENLLLLVALMALALGVAAMRLSRRNLASVEVRCEVPLRAEVGRPAALRYEALVRRGPPATGLVIRDPLARGARPPARQVEVPSVGVGRPTEVEALVEFAQRGEHPWRGLELESRFPLGLFATRRTIPCQGTVRVWPRRGRATHRLRERLRGRQVARAGRTRSGEELFYGIRERRDGDDARRIHWRSSARRGTLVVSEWHDPPGREALLVLALGRGSVATRERAISGAATVWHACAQERLDVRLLVHDPRAPTQRELPRGLVDGLDCLAGLGPATGAPSPAALSRAGRQGRSRTVVCVASGPVDSLLGALGAAAGPGGEVLVLRSDQRSFSRWVRGLE